MRPKIRITGFLTLLVAAIAFPFGLQAQTNGSANIAATDVLISGSSLALEDVNATTGLNIPVSIQTSFGGLKNEQAPVVPELTAVGDLTGPGIETPIQLQTAPGHSFTIPGLSAEGVYLLQNVRLMRGGTFVQNAVPSSAAITVADILKTKVSVRQLTAAELRARGIMIDARNFDVYEYTLSFFVGNQEVLVPFPVIVDKRTHEVTPLNSEPKYSLPGFKNAPSPPRWGPPSITPMELVEPGALPDPPPQDDEGTHPPSRPSIPAAIVIPNSLGVLHSFFAVALSVTNNAPAGSSITLDSITATMKNPPELRVADTKPAVSFGRPVPLVDPNNGNTILIAQGEYNADWTLEGLKTGTHTFTVEVHATYKASSTADPIALKGVISQQLVIHDPRFNITFSHPDTVRAGLTYSTFTFVTNMTSVTQTIRLRTGDELPACSIGGGADVCRLDDDISNIPLCSADTSVDVCRPSDDLKAEELTLKPGATRTLIYKLRSNLTGNVFATAGTVDSDVIHAAVQLHMGVSTSGIPLSPATLVMPYYAQYLDQQFIADNLQLLGLGYSLATAPVNQVTAAFPRVITTDVFHRAVDIARAGQRIFIGEDRRDTLANLTLDLLGNGGGNKLIEWDELRREEYSGRVAGAALGRQLEAASLPASSDFDTFLARFGQTTAHRAPYLVAVTHGAPVTGNDRPYALSLKGVATHALLDVPNELATEAGLGKREVAFGDLTKLTSVDHARTGEMAAVGLWSENYELTVTPAAGSSFTLDVLYPSTTATRIQHAVVSVTNASGRPLKALLDPASAMVTLLEEGGSASYSANATTILPAPLAIVAAHQDLHLDNDGHKVSVLFNRPVDAATDYKTKFAGKVNFHQGSITYNGPRGVDAAALQDDERTLNLTFDHSLSTNAAYSIQVQPVTDPLSGSPVSLTDVVPVIDNNRPAGIIYGRVLRGDNSIVPGAQVTLKSISSQGMQYDVASSDKADFLFEYILRDVANGVGGAYQLQAVDENGKHVSVNGAIRLTGIVETVNLVYLGRGSAEGRVTYDNGEVVPNAKIVIGSTLFNQFRNTITGSDGRYHVSDLPVGPLTFSATDASGNSAFAASEVRSAGEIVTQDLSIYRQPFPGTGKIRGIVVRSDNQQPVPNAHVGVYTQGFGLADGYTDADGRFEFDKVVSGLVTVLAEDYSISRKTVGEDFDLANDQVKDLTLTLEIVGDEPLANLEGDVEEENPLAPGTYSRVPGALVQIQNMQVVTADADGHFVYKSLQLTQANKQISVYNPASKRAASTTVPTLDPLVTAYLRIPIRVSDAFGTGTVQVRVLNAGGQPVSNLRVFEPGFPTVPFQPLGNGKYQLRNVRVGSTVHVWAITTGDANDPITSRYTYGDQYTNGDVSLSFNGQTSLTVFRLPGQGKVRVRLFTDIQDIGNVNLTYRKWDDEEQGLKETSVTQSTKDPATNLAGYAIFDKVPAAGFSVFAALANFGYDSASRNFAFDGQVLDIDLHAKKLASLAGVVYGIDGITPMPGVPVKMTDGAQTQTSVTALDGSFKFGNVAAGNGFTITAEATVAGISRVGRADGVAPSIGGPLNNISVVMKQQGSVEGFVVYSGYKIFDPADPSKNVLDTTPNDPSDNARVPLAQFFLRELSYPYHFWGKETAPLTADITGHFIINNVFVGDVRLTGWSQQNQDLRGDGRTTLVQEGSTAVVYAQIGAQGFGPLAVTVVDPNKQNQPVENAEVALAVPQPGGPPAIFDFGTTDASGTIRFEQVPARNGYELDAFSKTVGKSGKVTNVNVLPVNGASAVISLEFSGSVNGTLTDPEAAHAGVPGIPVILKTSTYQQETSTATNGSFFLGGIHEGTFVIDALQESSRRRAHGQGAVSAADPNPTVDLELEHTSSLYVKVFYPNDDGSMSNIEVPTADVDVRQRCKTFFGAVSCEYTRTLQGNGLVFTNLFANEGYGVTATEIGGDRRVVSGGGAFPLGATADNPFKLKLPAFGTVEVTVRQPGPGGVMEPATGARVGVASKSITTDTTGVAIAHNVALGNVAAYAVSFDGLYSAYSPVFTLASQSTPLKITLDLAASAGIKGLVNAETGGPSVQTRVVAGWPGHSAMTLTDATGSFTFQGIAVSSAAPTVVGLTYYGPDDKTIGAAQSTSLTVADVSTIKDVPPVTLDATPPTVVTFKPDDNSINVTPDTQIVVAFSEPIAAGTITNANFRLQATDGSAQVTCGLNWIVDPATGLFTVTMTPPASTDPAQRFPLKSNMLYRVTIDSGVTDLQGHPLALRGFTFITADYIAPKVILLEPATNAPLSASTTFQIHFNKPLASELFSSNHNVVAPLEVHLFKLDAQGGTPVSEVPGSAYGDLANQVISFAPSEQLAEKSYYRLTLIGVRDKVGNVADTISFDYVSYDRTAPFITFEPLPTPVGTPLVSGVRYTLHTLLRDGSTTGAVATDVQRVEFSQVVGTSKTLLASIQKAPFEYSFTAPNVTTTGTTLTFHVDARDTSLNDATPQEITFDVAPNLPPQNVTLTLNTPDPIYPGTKVSATPSLSDEGLLVTLQAQLTGTNIDGTTYTSTRISGQANRTKTSDPWVFTPATFEFVLPATLADGSTASITMTASDGVNAIVNATPATFTVAADTALPVVSSVTVSPASPYNHGDKYTITAIVKDAESGIADLTFTYDGVTTDPPMKIGDPGVTALGGGSYRFVSPQITASTKNEDTRIAIITTARDLRGNKGTGATEVTYVGVHDTRLPRGEWVSPIGNAAWPSDQPAFATTLRVWAKDDESITGVKFVVPGIADPVAATLAGNDVYTAPITIATPAAGSSFTISALISDADPDHKQTITIPITLVHIDTTLPPNFTQAITSTNDAMANTNVLVKGPNTHLVMHVPFTFRNLIVLDGGSVETLASTTSSEKKLDITVRDTLYVDSSSFIDVSGKGYVGGWGPNQDGSGTRNNDSRGRTVGNTVTGGSNSGSAASHGGAGGENGGVTNAIYGSITDPRTLGAGGGGGATCCNAGGQGGGAVSISGGSGGSDLARIIVAGSIKADGVTAFNSAGAGGSVRLNSKVVSLSRNARVSANGSDEGSSATTSRGSGGGRLSIVASEQLETDETLPQFQARGGRNGNSEGKTYVDGGAGTVYVRRPGQYYGELILASLDERATATTHQTRPTILGYTGSGSSSALTANTLTDSSRTFVSDAIGEEILLGGDLTKSYTITTVSADGHTLTTDSADGSLLDAGGVSNGVVSYSGLLAFDAISVSDRALARFDDSISIGGIVDDASKATVTTNGVLLLRTDVPLITSFTTTPADGAQLTRGTTLNVNYNATSAAGIHIATLAFSPVATPFTDTYDDYASPASKTNKPLPVATNAPLDAATLTLSLTDRAGRKFTSAPLHYTVIENQAPAITKFDVTPASLYAGHSIAVDAAASDDFAVTALSLTTTPTLTVTPATAVTNGTSMTRTFTVAVPAATPSGTSIQLNLAADDAFPHTTTQQKSVAVLLDPNPPALNATSPHDADDPYLVASGNTIPMRATAVDAEVGLTSVYGTLDGVRFEMTPDSTVPNGWKADVQVPVVDGTDTVTKPVIIYAKDYDNNVAQSATINIRIKPNFDPIGPSVSLLCPTSGALLPAGYTAKLRVNAVPGRSDNAVTGVSFFVNGSSTPVAASLVSGTTSTWEAPVPMPSVGNDGDPIAIRIEAKSFLGNTNNVFTTVYLVTGGQVIDSDMTIGSSSTQYENATVIIKAHQDGSPTTVTIDGTHTFTRLLVLDNVNVIHPLASGAVNVTTTGAMYVSCLGSFDVTGKGYQDASGGFGRTWPNTFTGGSTGNAGGTHGGLGGTFNGGIPGAVYGSIMNPNEPGSVGVAFGACNPCSNVGGGIVRLKASSLILDGKISANGKLGGAGGSVRLEAANVAGAGTVSADGGDSNNGNSAGGGGRIAVHYQTLSLPKTNVVAAGGGNSSDTRAGTNGTVYFRQNTPAGDKVTDELVADQRGRTILDVAPLPELGTGTVTAINGNVLTLSAAVPDSVIGSWIEILDANSNVIAAYEITARTSTTVTVQPAPGFTTPAPYRGSWKFDLVTTRNNGILEGHFRTPLIAGSGAAYIRAKTLAPAPFLTGNEVLTLRGALVEANGAVTAPALNLTQGANLTHSYGKGPLSINVAGTFSIDSTSAVDLTGRGFVDSQNGYGHWWGGFNPGGALGDASGSHGGVGAYAGGGTPGVTYDSPIDPIASGAAGGSGNQTCTFCTARGGGVARIKAGTLNIDGKIVAASAGGSTAGAGGAIRIDATTVSGTGEIRADAADAVNTGFPQGQHQAGGGGRVAVYYQNLALDKSKITAAGGNSDGANEVGGAGTVYLRKVDASSNKLSDELLFDNRGRTATVGTSALPALGTGTVTAINGNVITLSAAPNEWCVGMWIELFDVNTGVVRSSYEISARNVTAKTVTVIASSVDASVGNGYRGYWKFDQVTITKGVIADIGDIRAPITADATATVRSTGLRGDIVFSGGQYEVSGPLNATSLKLQNGAVLTHPAGVWPLNINISGAMTIDSTSSIDVTARGYQDLQSGCGHWWGGYTCPVTNGTSGSHGGVGAVTSGSIGAPTYDSPIDPIAPGASGSHDGARGGGVVRLKAGSLTLDGKIIAASTGSWTGGAGGSIRVDVGTLSGAGQIRADAGEGVNMGFPYGRVHAGGGGRAAVYYQSLNGFNLANVTAAGGDSDNSSKIGSAGTVYLRNVDTSGNKVSDELVLDNRGRVGLMTSDLPILAAGTGTVTAINGNVITLSAAPNEWCVGMWIELLDGTGNVQSKYEITARDVAAKTVTVNLAGETAVNAQNGTAYRGSWKFDKITARGAAPFTLGNVRTTRITGDTSTPMSSTGLAGDDSLVIHGIVMNLTAGGITAADGLTLESATTLNAASLIALKINAANSLTIDATSSINADGKGYSVVASGTGQTWPGTTAGGSFNNTGGSHGGLGAQDNSANNVAQVYGSLFDPNEPGGAGGDSSSTSGTAGGAGGGVIRIVTKAFSLAGKIQANGTLNHTGGAGGSIRIDAETIGGSGDIHADGGNGSSTAAGGGGRVALYFNSNSIPAAKITALGGTSNSTQRTGGAGTVFLKPSGQTFGDLIVDNGGRATVTKTPLVSVNINNTTAFTAASVTNGVASFLGPNHLAGEYLIFGNDTSKAWPIVANTATAITVTPDANFTPANGTSFRGLFQFNSLTVKNANVQTPDLVRLTNSPAAVDQSTATLVTGNAAPPAIDLSKITIVPNATGASVVGTAGAVTDPEPPIRVTVADVQTGTTFAPVNANSDGSFVISVQGNAGDTITIKAKDSHLFPLETSPVTVGTLTAGTPTPTQVNRTDWTSDAAFLPRTLAVEGNLMAVASREDGSTGTSDKVVILDVSDPLRPALKRVISTGSRVLDIRISKGFLFVANNRFSSFDLNDPNSTQHFAADQSGDDYSLVISGGYAFTGEVNWANDGRINVYDISNPAAPRFLSMQAPTGIAGNAFNSLFAYGTDYLVGVNGWGGSARDVIVFDRRNVNAITKVGELQISNFNAFRGKLVGSKLYLDSDTSAEMVVVDLTNPAAPVVAGRITLPTTGTPGLDVVAGDVFIANKTAGVTATTADPASLAITGNIPTGGSAWDVVVQSGTAYVANETGLSIVSINAAPVIRTDRISLALSGANVVVTGASRAVTGGSPTVTIVDTATNAAVTNLPVNADGSFSATLPAVSGDPITLTATNFKSNGPVSLGLVPFGGSPVSMSVSNPNNDALWRARMVRTEGNNLVLASFPADGINNEDLGNSNKIVLFDISNPAAPVQKRVISTVTRILNVQIANGWAYVAGERFGTVNLNDQSSTVNVVSNDPSGNEYGLAISGNYAFTGEVDWANDGRINVYDITVPGSPRLIRQSPNGMTAAGGYFNDLIPYGTDYLVALSTGNSNTDVWVIDRKNVNNLFKVGQLSIANLIAFRGRIAGTKLYLGGYNGGSAIVNLSNPALPTLVTSLTTTPNSRGVDLSGGTLAVANAGSGVAFYDVSANTLRALGTQPLPGTAWDVAYGAGELYVAAESSLVVLPNVTAPPIVDTRLINVGAPSSSLASITGNAGAVTGHAPFTAELKDVNSSATSSVTINADGSFSVSMPANPGDAFTLKVTDSDNRVTGPVALGTMPFAASMTTVRIANPNGDTLWRARMVRNEGNNLLLGSFPADGTPSEDTGNSNKVLLYDVSNPASPQFKRTITTVTRVLNAQIVNGWAYVVGERFGTINLNDPNSTINLVSNDPSGNEYGLAISGNYAFTGETDWAYDGRINVYDITKPGSPRLIRQSPSGLTQAQGFFNDLIPYGTDYLVALSTGSSNVDVWVIDRRNVNNLFKVGQLTIANVVAFRGRIAGTKLYLGGYNGGAAIVDLTNPASPTLVTSNTVASMSRGVDLSGSTLAVANGGQGVAFYDVASNALTPIGSQLVGGTAWDVSYGHGALYVAADTSLVVLPNVSAPAIIDTRLISVGASSATMAAVTGGVGAVTGQLPLATELKDVNSGATISVNVAADGSLSSSLPATPGDTFTLKVTDGNGRVTGPVVLGTMPFGTAITATQVSNPNGDTLWRSRMVRTEGNNLLLASFPADGISGEDTGNSNKIVLFDISNPAAPQLKRTITTVNRVLNAQIVNGWAYVVGERFGTINLNDPSSTINLVSNDPSGNEYGLAISGNYAFTGETDWAYDGRINVYDISDPALPRLIRQSPSGLTAAQGFFNDLIPYGADYLVGLSTGSSNVDVWVIDRRNVNNLFKVGQLSIANVVAFRGRIVGTKLYLGGYNGGSAIVDLSTPTSPTLVSSVTSTTIARGVDIAGSTLAVANGGLGVAFYDVSSNTFNAAGTQPTGGVAWDCAFNGANLYVANDLGLVVIQNVVAPPLIDTRQISVMSDGTNAVVHGNATAISGLGSLTVDVKDAATGAVVTVSVNGNGSFDASVPASAGDSITVKAIDGVGRTAGPIVVGTVPFGSAMVNVPVVKPGNDSLWRSRMVRTEGNNLVLASFPADSINGEDTGNSNKIVLFDITDPAATPQLKRTITTVNRVLNVQIVNGWAYVAGERFGTVNLNDPNSTVNTVSNDPSGNEYGLAVSGGYAFTGEVDWANDGRLNIYDVSDPGSPRLVRQSPSGMTGTNSWYSDLIAYGTNYLIATSTGSSGVDVFILDRRDVWNVFKVGQLSIPNMLGFRSKLVGTKLYVSGWDGGTAIVDVSNPASPQLVTSTTSTPISRGGDVSGSTLAVPYGGEGIAFYDVSINTLRSLGMQPTGGVAYDASFSGGNLYVANDLGLAIIRNVMTPPAVQRSLINVTSNGTTATIAGGAHSIGGASAVTISITNAATGASISGVAVNADGSFSTSITGKAGDALTLVATDAAGRAATRPLGLVPFFSVSSEVRATRNDDVNMQARRVATDGTNTVTTTSTANGFYSGADKALFFLNGSTTGTQFTAGVNTINDVTTRGNWAYFASDRLSTVDMTAATLTRNLVANDPSGRDMSIALIGNYAVTGEGGNNDDARLNVYDVTNPAAPVHLRQNTFSNGSTDYYSLIPYNAQYLIGLSSNQPGVAGDVAVFDISNIASTITRVKALDIPSFSGNYGALDGTWLYVVGYFNNVSSIAIVDMSVPANPVIRSTIATPGFARKVAVSGTNEIVVADSGGPGLTFIDVTDKTHPVITGSQQVNGNPFDVKVVGKTLYVGAETRFMTLQRP